MARECALSGTKTAFGGNRKHRRGKSGAGGVWRFKAPRTTRTWQPNLRKVKVVTPEGQPMRITVAMKIYKRMRAEGGYAGFTLAV